MGKEKSPKLANMANCNNLSGEMRGTEALDDGLYVERWICVAHAHSPPRMSVESARQM